MASGGQDDVFIGRRVVFKSQDQLGQWQFLLFLFSFFDKPVSND